MRICIAFLALAISTPVYAQDFGSTSGATSMLNVSNPASTTSKNRLITPPPVGAPGLAAAGIETCLGSASGGVSLMGGGVTFGATRVDEGCTIRLLSRQLFAFGLQKAAIALMCQDERVAAAMAATGAFCPNAAAVSALAEVPERNSAPTILVQPPTRGEQPTSDEQTRKEQVWFNWASR